MKMKKILSSVVALALLVDEETSERHPIEQLMAVIDV